MSVYSKTVRFPEIERKWKIREKCKIFLLFTWICFKRTSISSLNSSVSPSDFLWCWAFILFFFVFLEPGLDLLFPGPLKKINIKYCNYFLRFWSKKVIKKKKMFTLVYFQSQIPEAMAYVPKVAKVTSVFPFPLRNQQIKDPVFFYLYCLWLCVPKNDLKNK